MSFTVFTVLHNGIIHAINLQALIIGRINNIFEFFTNLFTDISHLIKYPETSILQSYITKLELLCYNIILQSWNLYVTMLYYNAGILILYYIDGTILYYNEINNNNNNNSNNNNNNSNNNNNNSNNNNNNSNNNNNNSNNNNNNSNNNNNNSNNNNNNTFINDNHIISSLPYRFDIDTFDNGRSNGIQIDHSVKITNHNMSNFNSLEVD
ncbi:hypothetical protein H8356DRAFT_1340440 [Neocallimastix lanati (nom. inval.)]|nr:hypothetical protein H8356DRAFT_1340440 [Neocallimastix sp. JGI-2020a]